ncbi:hypothetical protein HZR84_14305 [Hyphobacterium sp. CCMP332]|nr:hypothetical protein HZR84_14305 [Hyphobacterium sp. CCMP332]
MKYLLGIIFFLSGSVLFAQTWHSQKDYTSEYEDNGSIGTIGKVGIGFHHEENLIYPPPNVSEHPQIPYYPQKSLHILGYEDIEYSEFLAPIPTIRLDHRYTYESGGGGGGGSQSRSGGPDPTSYVEILTAQDVWDMENNQG